MRASERKRREREGGRERIVEGKERREGEREEREGKKVFFFLFCASRKPYASRQIRETRSDQLGSG